jgi:hypothetical protein
MLSLVFVINIKTKLKSICHFIYFVNITFANKTFITGLAVIIKNKPLMYKKLYCIVLICLLLFPFFFFKDLHFKTFLVSCSSFLVRHHFFISRISMHQQILNHRQFAFSRFYFAVFIKINFVIKHPFPIVFFGIFIKGSLML